MKKFKTEILGQKWNVCLCTDQEENRLKECMGFTDWTSRKIVIGRIPNDDTNLDQPIVMLSKVLRHEMVHAFMFSSGLGDDWTHPAIGHDELTVDWVAYHLYRIALACTEAESNLVSIIMEEKHDGTGED